MFRRPLSPDSFPFLSVCGIWAFSAYCLVLRRRVRKGGEGSVGEYNRAATPNDSRVAACSAWVFSSDGGGRAVSSIGPGTGGTRAMQPAVIQRHKTAIRRGDFSRPVK